MKLRNSKATLSGLIVSLLVASLTAGCDSQMVGFSQDPNKDMIAKGEGADAERVLTSAGSDTSASNDSAVSDDPLVRYEKTFAAGRKESSEAKFQIGRSSVQTTVDMRSNFVDERKSENQVTRMPMDQSFRQGNPGMAMVQEFNQVQAKNGPIDILLVVDSSGSMSQEQTNLSTKLEPLLSAISTADWQIAVVSTDPRAGCRQALLKKSDPDVATRFGTAVQNVGIRGSGNERGFLMARVGLQGSFAGIVDLPAADMGPCANEPWLRANAPVAVIIVSDEDNCSRVNTTTGFNDCRVVENNVTRELAYGRADYLANYLASIRTIGATGNARAYGIIRHADDKCETAPFIGTRYTEGINLIHGVTNTGARTSGAFGNICATDYTSTLTAISQNIATILDDSFVLNNPPDANSVRVFVNGEPRLVGWSVTGTVLRFSQNPPAAGSRLRVEYIVGAREIRTSWNLAAVPARETLEVMLDGQLVPANRFSYRAPAAPTESAAISFAEPVPYDSEIRVRYRVATPPLKTRFDLGMEVDPASLVVQVGDQTLTSGFSYDAVTGELVFAQAPIDGAAIVADFKRRVSRVLSYPLSAIAGVAPRNLRAVVLEGMTPVPVTWENGMVTFPMANHQDGRRIGLSWLAHVTVADMLELPHEPIADSLSVMVGSTVCPSEMLTMSTNQLTLGCELGYGDDDIVVKYNYVADQALIFPMLEVLTPDRARWSVSVDGVALPTTGFTRKGNIVSLVEPASVDAKVTVVAETGGT